jgi:hypothetical protein
MPENLISYFSGQRRFENVLPIIWLPIRGWFTRETFLRLDLWPIAEGRKWAEREKERERWRKTQFVHFNYKVWREEEERALTLARNEMEEFELEGCQMWTLVFWYLAEL